MNDSHAPTLLWGVATDRTVSIVLCDHRIGRSTAGV